MKTFDRSSAEFQLRRIKELSNKIINTEPGIIQRLKDQEEWNTLTNPLNMNNLINYFESKIDGNTIFAPVPMPESVHPSDTYELRVLSPRDGRQFKLGGCLFRDEHCHLRVLLNRKFHVFNKSNTHIGIIELKTIGNKQYPKSRYCTKPVVQVSDNICPGIINDTETFPDFLFTMIRGTHELKDYIGILDTHLTMTPSYSLRDLMEYVKIGMEIEQYNSMFRGIR
ncbi:structural protein [Yersinia phage vB_Yru_GN1]|uniref:Structural protein n=1 Tax=Yersinia phage vB_Yru_GN1 TaxID=3074381 RepID=A0AA86J4X3_9CAUD|nr:structural protein [Yersinia phage vB_Yru_GN1]